jgi:hypothetical protein
MIQNIIYRQQRYIIMKQGKSSKARQRNRTNRRPNNENPRTNDV